MDESRVLKVIDHLLETNYPVIKKAGPPDGSKNVELDGLSPEDLQLLEPIAIGGKSSPAPTDPLQSLHVK